ncbi:MAG: hypothetical protein SXQ77_08840, partial [Halobacteria archaeon]|nr:hypothetical protein [Halobacteria archaeon]
MQRPQPKTTFRGTNDSGQTEVRKAFAVERSNLKVWKEENESGTEVTHIEVPVSSTAQDRDGDAFSEEGLEDLKRQLDSGTIGMWLDHGLSPETMFPDYRTLEQIGGWKEGIIEEEDGRKFLSAKGALRPSSEDAAELETMLNEGIAPVGFSVGFIVESENESEEIPEELARAISEEQRKVLGFGSEEATDHETETTQSMNGEPARKRINRVFLKQPDDDGFETAQSVLNSYIDAEDTDTDDPV